MQNIKERSSTTNAIIIYDQMLQFENEDVLLNLARITIQFNSKLAFDGECFTEINEKTLIDLLNFESLNIDEIDLLIACSRWVDAECARNGLSLNSTNKRKIFKPIKPFIQFSKLTIDQLREFNQIEHLLTVEEVASLFVHLLDKSKKFQINCRSERKMFKWLTTIGQGSSNFTSQTLSEITILLNVNQSILVKSIHTLLKKDVKNVSIKIFEIDKALDRPLSVRGVFNVRKDRYSLDFQRFFRIEPNKDYKVVFKFDRFSFSTYSDQLSRSNKIELKDEHESFVFNLNFDNLSCIDRIEFCKSTYYP